MFSCGSNEVLSPFIRSLLPATPPAASGAPVIGAGGDGVMGTGGGEVEVWKSVVSALCTATNNPQNGKEGKGTKERGGGGV